VTGTVGALPTGVFASTAINSAGANGLRAGNPGLLLKQVIGVGATIVDAAGVTFVIPKVVDVLFGLRMKEQVGGLRVGRHGPEGSGSRGSPDGARSSSCIVSGTVSRRHPA